ncbi:transposase [bacterium]|nr:transposase [bacterium]
MIYNLPRVRHYQAAASHHHDGVSYFVTSNTRDRLILPDVARKIALDSFKHFNGVRYKLYAACVMPDHFHLLLYLMKDENGEYFKLSSVMNSLKGYSSHKIGRELGIKGGIWHRGYYDVVVNTRKEKSESWEYILHNPVRAGIVKKWLDYPYVWSSGMP